MAPLQALAAARGARRAGGWSGADRARRGAPNPPGKAGSLQTRRGRPLAAKPAGAESEARPWGSGGRARRAAPRRRGRASKSGESGGAPAARLGSPQARPKAGGMSVSPVEERVVGSFAGPGLRACRSPLPPTPPPSGASALGAPGADAVTPAVASAGLGVLPVGKCRARRQCPEHAPPTRPEVTRVRPRPGGGSRRRNKLSGSARDAPPPRGS